jgi:hypothetical protein
VPGKRLKSEDFDVQVEAEQVKPKFNERLSKPPKKIQRFFCSRQKFGATPLG